MTQLNGIFCRWIKFTCTETPFYSFPDWTRFSSCGACDFFFIYIYIVPWHLTPLGQFCSRCSFTCVTWSCPLSLPHLSALSHCSAELETFQANSKWQVVRIITQEWLLLSQELWVFTTFLKVLPVVVFYFDYQECFKGSWASHKLLHKKASKSHWAATRHFH